MNQEDRSNANYSIIFIFLLCFVLIGVDRTGQFQQLRPLTTTIYKWVLLLSAFALLLGILNIAQVHLQSIKNGQIEWGYSLVLLITMGAVLIIGLLDISGTSTPLVDWIFNNIIAPLQSALFAITAFFLAAAAYRFLRIGRTGSMWILIGALLMLVLQMPISHTLLTTTSESFVHWLLNVPIMAALRGVIIGGSMSLLLIATRFILDRP